MSVVEAQKQYGFRFIDLFAGIGGMRIAFEAIGGQCVFTSEWDKYAQKTYAANFTGNHTLAGDITKIAASETPPIMFCWLGFPASRFLLPGYRRRMR
jgi:DNA (cytosine-5)-methyltransferase 1